MAMENASKGGEAGEGAGMGMGSGTRTHVAGDVCPIFWPKSRGNDKRNHRRMSGLQQYDPSERKILSFLRTPAGGFQAMYQLWEKIYPRTQNFVPDADIQRKKNQNPGFVPSVEVKI